LISFYEPYGKGLEEDNKVLFGHVAAPLELDLDSRAELLPVLARFVPLPVLLDHQGHLGEDLLARLLKHDEGLGRADKHLGLAEAEVVFVKLELLEDQRNTLLGRALEHGEGRLAEQLMFFFVLFCFV